MNSLTETPFKIAISHTQKGDHFLLTVEFSTSSQEPIHLQYQAPVYRLAGKNLQFIRNGDQRPLSPVMRNYPVSHARTDVALTVGEPHVFSMEGIYDPPRLKFPSAAFELLPSVTYLLKFSFRGVCSNEIELTMPAVAEPVAPSKLRALNRLLYGPVSSEAEEPVSVDQWIELLDAEE